MRSCRFRCHLVGDHEHLDHLSRLTPAPGFTHSTLTVNLSTSWMSSMYPGTWAASTPDKPALVIAETGQTTTYAELDERSLRLAHVFADAGLVTGDVVALISDNAPEAYEVYWAALRSGLYVTAVNHHLSPDEAAYIVNDCGAKALVVSRRQGRAGRGDGRAGRRPGAAGLRWRRPRLHVVRRGAGRRRAPSRWPTSRTATTSSTPRARPGGPRGSSCRCCRSRSTSPAIPT